jgi:hypothetical protein
MQDLKNTPISSKNLNPYVNKAIGFLVKNQLSDTLILSSYKINTILKNYYGIEFKLEKIGRCLARIAKQHQLKKISTRIPKYVLNRGKFVKFPNDFSSSIVNSTL